MKKHMEVAMGHKKKTMCRYYQNNRCRFGRFCKYQHSELNVMQKGTKNQQSNKQCNKYDKCSTFPSCGYEHREICKYQTSCRNYQCSYVHLEEPFLGKWMRTLRKF